MYGATATVQHQNVELNEQLSRQSLMPTWTGYPLPSKTTESEKNIADCAGTNFFGAMEAALRLLDETKPGMKKMFIFMTDGEDNAEGKYGDYAQKMKEIKTTHPTLDTYVVSFALTVKFNVSLLHLSLTESFINQDDSKPEVKTSIQQLTTLAASAGGRDFIRAKNAADLTREFKNIADPKTGEPLQTNLQEQFAEYPNTSPGPGLIATHDPEMARSRQEAGGGKKYMGDSIL